MWTEELNWPRVCTKKNPFMCYWWWIFKMVNLTRLINFFVKFLQMIPGAKKFNFGYPSLEIRITRVCTHFFSIKTFYNKKWTIVCKRTDHPYCICAFLNESFAISKVYHYTYARMLWTQFLLYYWAAEKWTTQEIFVCHSVFTH